MDRHPRLSGRCPVCTGHRRLALFDLAVRRVGETHEALLFEVPAALCPICGDFRLDPEVASLDDIEDREVVSAIMSDTELGTAESA